MQNFIQERGSIRVIKGLALAVRETGASPKLLPIEKQESRRARPSGFNWALNSFYRHFHPLASFFILHLQHIYSCRQPVQVEFHAGSAGANHLFPENAAVEVEKPEVAG